MMTTYDMAVSTFVVLGVFLSQGAVFMGGMAAQRILDRQRMRKEKRS
jgi:hypothetical protein